MQHTYDSTDEQCSRATFLAARQMPIFASGNVRGFASRRTAPYPRHLPPPRAPRHLTSPPIRPQRLLRPLHHSVFHRSCASSQLIRLSLQQLRRAHARRLARQQRNAFAHMPHGVDMEQPAFHSVQHAAVQHQVALVAGGNEHALGAVQPRRRAGAEPAFDLCVDAAHGQHFTVLVEGAGDGNALAQRQPRQAGQQCVQLRTRGRVTFHAAVFLLEHDGGVERQRCHMAEQRREVAVQYQHALVMDGAGHVHFALDVEQALLPGKRARGDAHRKAKSVVAQIDLREGIDLPGDAAGVSEGLSGGGGCAEGAGSVGAAVVCEDKYA